LGGGSLSTTARAMEMKHLGRYRTGGTGNTMQLGIPLPTTPDGRVYRYSPNENAHPRHFVLGGFDEAFEIAEASQARMKIQPRSKQTVCPYSGVVAADAEFEHPDDRKAALEIVRDAAVRDVEDAVGSILRDFNSRSSSSALFRVEAKLKPRPHQPKPRFARRDLLRELVCEHCRRDYGVFAIGLFCPDCGAPNLRLHFMREVELVRQQVELATAKSDDAEELAYRLLGNAHEDVLTAFEATQKAVYRYGKVQVGVKLEDIKPVGNDFQNVDRARRRFAELGIDPANCLDPKAHAILNLNIQKRHIIGHNLGVMDAKFAEHAEDARIGETVRLAADDVLAFANSCQRIVAVLDDWLTGSAEAAQAIPPRDQPDAPPAEENAVANPNSGLDISALAHRLGLWIAQKSEKGISDMIGGEDVAAAFPGDAAEALEEAIAELEMEGYLKTHEYGDGLPALEPTVDLFAAFDPQAIGSDPLADAGDLIRRILEDKRDVEVAELHAATGLTLRRFNPALGLVLPNIQSSSISEELGSDYPAGYFSVMPADRVLLKRFLARSTG
jgi:hypothetical protein